MKTIKYCVSKEGLLDSLLFLFLTLGGISYLSTTGIAEDARFTVFGFNKLYIIFLIEVLICFFAYRRNRISAKQFILVFYLLGTFSFGAVAAGLSLSDINATISFALFLLTTSAIALHYKNDIVKIFRVCIFISVLSSLFAMALFLKGQIGNFIQPFGYTRAVGWYGNPNKLATVLALGFMFSCYFILQKKDKIYYLYALLIFSGLVLTGTKTILLLLSIFFALFVLSTVIKAFLLIEVSFFKIALSALGVAAALGAFVFLQSIDHGLLRALDDIESLSSASGRTTIWAYYLSDYLNGDFIEQLFGKGRLYLTRETDLGRSAHSFYIRALLEHGLLYLFFVMAVLLTAMVALYRRFRKSGRSHQLLLVIVLFFSLLRNITTPELLDFGSMLTILNYVTIFYWLANRRSQEYKDQI